MKLPYSISANTFNYLFLVVLSILSVENRTYGKEVRLRRLFVRGHLSLLQTVRFSCFKIEDAIPKRSKIVTELSLLYHN